MTRTCLLSAIVALAISSTMACGESKPGGSEPQAGAARGKVECDCEREGRALTNKAAPSGADHAAHANGEHGAHQHGAAMQNQPAPLADMSIYQLEGAWTDARSQAFSLASLRGKPVVAVMFYGSCSTVCPMLLRDAKRLDAALSEHARAQTRYVLVTLDPARDTTERLAELETEHGADRTRFHFLRGADDDVRALANVLGIQYRTMAGGEIAHTAAITLLDPEGVVAQQVVGLAQPVDELARRVESMSTQTP